MTDSIKINRAAVLTLWAAVVAERLGHDRDEALTLGRAVAGLNAYSKGKSLGIYEEAEQPKKPEGEKERGRPARVEERVEVLGRAVPVVETPQGLRATSDGQPIAAASVERYLTGKFKDRLADATKAMQELAASFSPDELARRAYELYEQFRPAIPAGARGWGAYGELDLERVRKLGKRGG